MRIFNHTIAFTNLLCFVYYMFISISVTTGQISCDTGNLTSSNYRKNHNLFLLTLVSNVSLHGGYYTSTIGQDPDKVYGSTLCGGDSDPPTCGSCVNLTIGDMMTQCPNQKEAISWGGRDFPCLVHYSDRSIFGKLELYPRQHNYNGNNFTSNFTQFGQIWWSLMDRMTVRASSGTSKLKYATEEVKVTDSDTIYALMQCVPDISRSDCESCLRNYTSFMQNRYCGKRGGYVLGPSCIFHYESYPFYTVSVTAPPPPPLIVPSTSPPSSNNTTITKEKGGIVSRARIITVVSPIVYIMALAALITRVILRRRKQKQEIRNKQERKDADELDTAESLHFDFSTIRDATNGFSTECKLGEGGFGTVYKGKLPHGQEIAVKRLSKNTVQGEPQFKNEVLLVAKLQHRNLFRLLGFCFEGTERLLIYEFVPNSSLDKFLFDPIKRLRLDWETRYKIIEGIARGIRYLHEESRLRIIHRDLKASNVLLDAQMTPKISDFGMARLFETDQSQGDTSRVVGTFGYMAPEYVMRGHFSVKSDVFSFGVLVLEIISSQRRACLGNGEEAEDLLTYAWKNWNEETAINLIDPILRAGSSSEIVRCIHIGLLCVQENAAKRPTMASVVLMLNSGSASLPLATRPAFFIHTTTDQSRKVPVQLSVNETSITELDPR